MSNEQKAYMAENRIEHQMSMPDSLQQKGRAERFQQTIINGAEAMQHHTVETEYCEMFGFSSDQSSFGVL